MRTAKEVGRADGSYIRFDTNSAVLIDNAARADRHPHLRTGGARAARQAVHEDHLARARGAVRTSCAARITQERHRHGHRRPRARQDRQGPARAAREEPRRSIERLQHGEAPHEAARRRRARAASSRRKRRSTSRTCMLMCDRCNAPARMGKRRLRGRPQRARLPPLRRAARPVTDHGRPTARTLSTRGRCPRCMKELGLHEPHARCRGSRRSSSTWASARRSRTPRSSTRRSRS